MPISRPSSTTLLTTEELPFSLESRAWLAAAVNNKLSEPNKFKPENIIRVPRGNNQFDYYLINTDNQLGKGSNSQIYEGYKITVEGDIDPTSPPIAVKVVKSLTDSKKGEKDERERTIEGLKREAMAYKKMGNPLGDHIQDNTGDYLLMPLLPGKALGNSWEKYGEPNQPPPPKGSYPILLLPEVKRAKLPEKISLLYQLGEQLKKFHDNQLMHGDFHLHNIMVARDKSGKLTANVFDFDQSRVISNKDELITSDDINMASYIRPLEVMQKKVGAPSDIFALGLNYLFILGHPDPFVPDSKNVVSQITKEYTDSEEFKKAVEEFKNSDAQKAKDPDQQRMDLRDYIVRLKQTKLTEDYIEKEILARRKPMDGFELDKFIGELESIPIEVDGMPLRTLVKDFIAGMLNDDVGKRPKIDEVNAFMLGVMKIVSSPTAKIDNSEKAKEKWQHVVSEDPLAMLKFKNQILEVGKKQQSELSHSQTASSFIQPAVSDETQELYRAKLAVLLNGMKNVSQETSQKTGFFKKFSKKETSKPKSTFENNLVGIAGLYDAASSKDPKADYETIMKHLQREREQVSPHDAAHSSILRAIIKKAEMAEPKPEMQSSRSSFRR